MLRKTLLALALTAALPALPALAADEAQLLDEARKVATSIPPKLLEVLDDEIRKGGPENAIGVCREKAPQMAKAASEKTGWAIRRVSLKNRNPKAIPDAWEKAALEEFDRRAAAGEKPTGLEKGELLTVGGQQVYRYMKALPTQDLCLQCHGTPERVSPAVQARLHELYPDDKAVGYSAAEIRGAITIRKPL
ncbi:MAG: DUF3365 domain-containing protein [Rhodocyclaceae bacterium]|jgi:hypothetical protein|nr:DUF3365 domain-containing protein [Rhodocyclaceae bacterium]MBK6554794.1 DUF3365 domain-containing protein [Rhodocyclaceae bacterium]MBK9309927.1 DUF3365 domain-containing protein [Rhodocyclaceae bacterium]MBK9954998.1 DUF3365 domain-containing protein [Rhodocyclaceae bacterium]